MRKLKNWTSNLNPYLCDLRHALPYKICSVKWYEIINKKILFVPLYFALDFISFITFRLIGEFGRV